MNFLKALNKRLNYNLMKKKSFSLNSVMRNSTSEENFLDETLNQDKYS